MLLRTIQKLSYTEIAEIMQIPEGTAMSHVHRSKNELRNRLRPPALEQSAPATQMTEFPDMPFDPHLLMSDSKPTSMG